MSIGDDGVNWNQHWEEHKEDADFSNISALDYFVDLLPKNFKVLDIGCGSCKFYPLFKLLGCSEYVGVDFSPTAIDLAGKKFPELTLLLMRVEQIDFDSHFNLVFSNTLLQHTKIETKKKDITESLEKPQGEWASRYSREGRCDDQYNIY